MLASFLQSAGHLEIVLVKYLSDLIDLYEENGWHWDYHAFREFQGWNVELIGDKDHPQPSPVPTDRQLLLMKWFKKNEH
jgi:hypothetical protein